MAKPDARPSNMVKSAPKVAFVCLQDASNPNITSGGPHKIREAFKRLGCEVIDIFPITSWVTYIFLFKKAF